MNPARALPSPAATPGSYLTGGLAPLSTAGPTRLERLAVLADLATLESERVADVDPRLASLAGLLAQLTTEVAGLARSIDGSSW